MDLQRIRYRKNEAQEFRALTERLVGESGLDSSCRMKVRECSTL